ncbi:MAG TPA: class I SAM-dependent methyltransferase [Vicinamibacterales bacterium]|jgi:SAM-dependent methyltransferase|nr:class I SAM-dependent methyltransferase [Vicinamibacterales bacterium]
MAVPQSEFPEHAAENRRIWDKNAIWWDEHIGDGNRYQELLIEPATERLLEIAPGDRILDVACGAGRFARRMAALGADVVALDSSANFIDRARSRSAGLTTIAYHLIDASDRDRMQSLGRFDKAVCTMAVMDMPEIAPLLAALARVMKPRAPFVFSLTHPCFHSATVARFAEVREADDGRHRIDTGVKVGAYLTPCARKTEGILGQPEPQYFFHRPLHVLLRACFDAGFVMDGIEEPGFPVGGELRAGVGWSDMPEIPPILVVRMRLGP